MTFLSLVATKYQIMGMALTEITNPGFRYTFPAATIFNKEGIPPGLYKVDFRGDPIVLKVDQWGEIRIANETPCRNESRLVLELKKLILQ